MAKSIKLSEFDVNNIKVSAPKVNQAGGKNITTNYNLADDVIGLVFQTPRMLSFGVNKWVDPNNPNATPICSVTLSFMGMDTNPKLQEFHEALSALDNWAVDAASKNSWEWLSRKNLSRETLDTVYTHCIKVPLDQQTGEPNGKPHSMKIKLKSNDSGFSSVFFNKEKNIIPSEELELHFNKGSNVRALIQCTGFWVAAGKFGLSWKLLQMVVEPRPVFGKEYAFDDSEEDGEKTEADDDFTMVKRK
jgi:hypothetical protein